LRCSASLCIILQGWPPGTLALNAHAEFGGSLVTLHRWDTVEETLEGVGQVRSKGTLIADARYDLTLQIEKVTAQSFTMDKARFARKTVTGSITLLNAALFPGDDHRTPEGSFILVLDDGREVDFRIRNCVLHQNPTSQECLIHGSGNRL
jgi:hypothetical protein